MPIGMACGFSRKPDRRQRFWTDEDFPESKTVRDHIEAKLKSMGLGDPALKEACDSLQSAE